MQTREVTWSTFLRDPTSVDRWLRDGDVVLRRRDGEALRISRERAGTDERTVLATAVRMIGAFVGHSLAKDLEESVTERLPWTRFLPEQDRRQFVEEFVENLVACVDLGEFGSLARLIDDWRKTASLHAEGLAPRLRAPLPGVEKQSVKRP